MLKFLAENLYIVPIMAIIFMMLYMLGGEDIIFFKRKHYAIDPKANEKLVKSLNKFVRGRDFKVMGRTTIEFNGSIHTFDAILLSYYGAFGFAAAPQGGDIYGELNDEQWVAVFQGSRTPFYSPIMAMNGSVKTLKDIFRAEKVKCGNVESMAVFTNKDANVAVARSLAACHVNNLAAKLATPKYLADNGSDIDGMKAALEKYSK